MKEIGSSEKENGRLQFSHYNGRRKNENITDDQKDRFNRSYSLNSDITKIYGCEFDDLKEKCFEKQYSFKPIYRLEQELLLDEDIWEIPQLLQNKDLLNDVKNKLNDYDLKQWHSHTRLLNPAGFVMSSIKKNIEAEFVTQAWCKFHEIAYSYLFKGIEHIDENFFTVHLCEAPGAFIASLNHLLKSHFRRIKWKWIANTLNPFYEGNSLSSMINEDKLILETLENWNFGLDGTGDIFTPNYITHLQNTIRARNVNLNDVLLVTADGSFDCQDDPDHQESLVMPLHLMEALVGLKILAKGGDFVLKIFTTFECNTICLMYLLCCSFTKVNVFKPCTSKEGNSETYVVCNGYKRNQHIERCVDILLQNVYKNDGTLNNKAIFPQDSIPLDFIEEIICCSNKFTELQISVIERNIAVFESDEIIPKRSITSLKFEIFKEYCARYDLKKIDENEKLLPNSSILHSSKMILEPRETIEGSFSERKKKSTQNVETRIEDIEYELKNVVNYVKSLIPENMPVLFKNFDENTDDIYMPKFGKPIKKVNSSQFCYGGFIRLKNQLSKIYSYTLLNSPPGNFSILKKVIDGSIKTLKCSMECIYATCEDNDEAQKRSLRCIRKIFESHIENGYSFELSGLPLLTHFNVSLIYVLEKAFAQLKFIKPDKLLFNECRNKDKVVFHLTMIEECLEPSDLSVLYFVPIKYLRGNSFYNWILYVNNTVMEMQLNNMINQLKSNRIRKTD